MCKVYNAELTHTNRHFCMHYRPQVNTCTCKQIALKVSIFKVDSYTIGKQKQQIVIFYERTFVLKT